jgi:16S rRNA processing protein RimM
MILSENELFDFGTIIGLHGLRGDLKVMPHFSGAGYLADAQSIHLRSQNGDVVSYLPKKVSAHKGNTLLQLESVESAEQAEKLVGLSVLMPLADLPELPVGKYYWHELKGSVVIDRRCGNIGTLQGMFTTSAHDIYEVNGRFGEVMIPVVDKFIIEVDLDKKQIQVDLPEGLIPESDED